MPPITDAPGKPRQLKDISMIIDPNGNGATEFRKVVQSFQFVPQLQTTTVQGGTPDAVFTDTVVTGYQLQIKFLQDSETLGSLTDYLFTNKGKQKPINFVPYGGTGWSCIATLPAPPIGGDFQAWIADTITCGVVGLPYRIADDASTPQQ